MLVGLEVPDSGEILVGGQPLDLRAGGRAARLARAKAVQIVFQDPYLSLDPRIRVGDCIDGVLRLHTDLDAAGRAAQRWPSCCDQVGLGDARGRTPCRGGSPAGSASGPRSRVRSRSQPRVLVLDEAVSALDVSVQAQVLNLLDDIRRATGVGLVFVSHDLAVVRYVCDEVLVMRRGVVVEQRPTRDVLDAPEHPYTRLLLSSVPRPGWDLDAIARCVARSRRRGTRACRDCRPRVVVRHAHGGSLAGQGDLGPRGDDGDPRAGRPGESRGERPRDPRRPGRPPARRPPRPTSGSPEARRSARCTDCRSR